MNKRIAERLAEDAELIRQLCMSQLPTAQLANLTLHGLLRDVIMKAMSLRDELLACAECAEEEEKAAKPVTKKASPKRSAKKKA